jgi:hypothetical protein
MKKLAILTAAAGLGLALGACDSKAENEVEKTATAIDERAEAEADILEASEEGGPNEEAAEQKADQIREQGETTKDHLEDEADELDSAPQ